MKTLEVIIQYLNAENIPFDKDEFDYQYNSHPDHPSLLALSDALKFFNINNSAFKVEKTNINLLPNLFVALLKNEHSNFLSFVKKKGDTYTYTDNTGKKKSSLKQDFELLWDNVVLLVENNAEIPQVKVKKRYTLLIPLLLSIFIISIILNDLYNLRLLVFFIFPFVGLYLSVIALKDLFNTSSSIIDKLCNATSETSCKSVVNSDKWKVFDIISFSDLSILFFATQICSLFLMGLSDNQLDFFYIQTFLLMLSVPVMFVSLYYQKFIEKKWCPICLTIMGVLLFEVGYLLYLNSFFNLTISLSGSILFFLVASIMVTVWFPLKKLLTKINHLKDFELKANRFKRNYTIFKNTLLSNEKFKLPSTPLSFGNQNSMLEISIITSPFCSYCKEPHYLLKSILENYSDNVKISIIFNVHPKIEYLKEIAVSLIDINLSQGREIYYKAMNEWYDNKNIHKWLENFHTSSGNFNYELIIENQHEWCVNNGFNFTPCIFINGYEYPKSYDISDLPFFIEEIINDKSF